MTLIYLLDPNACFVKERRKKGVYPFKAARRAAQQPFWHFFLLSSLTSIMAYLFACFLDLALFLSAGVFSSGQ